MDVNEHERISNFENVLIYVFLSP